MKTSQIYSKVLIFSLRRFLFALLGLVALFGLPVLFFFITQNISDTVCVVATIVGLVLGIVAVWALSHFVSYILQAAQIAMITKAVREDHLPENVYTAGKEAVHSRFTVIAVFYAIRAAINAITSQITNAVTKVTTAIGGSKKSDGANVIAGLINAFVAIAVEYVNYCCLGWVFCHPEQSAVKATLDGAVLYFQNWKTLLKNAGKILLILLLTLAIIGGPIYLLADAITPNLNGLDAMLTEIAADMSDAENIVDPATLFTIINVIIALVIHGIVYSVFIEPYVLINVLRSYLASADENPPKLHLYEKVASLSKRFRKEMKTLDPVETA